MFLGRSGPPAASRSMEGIHFGVVSAVVCFLSDLELLSANM